MFIEYIFIPVQIVKGLGHVNNAINIYPNPDIQKIWEMLTHYICIPAQIEKGLRHVNPLYLYPSPDPQRVGKC